MEAINFLSYLFDCGLSYSSICTARSALSCFLNIQYCEMFGEHPVVKRFIKGVFELRPSLPRYKETWNVDIVLSFLEKLAPVKIITLKDLTLKLVMLIAILSGQRYQTLAVLKISEMRLAENKCIFHIKSLLKHSKIGKHIEPIELFEFTENENLCVIKTLKEYIERTEDKRKGDELFISYQKPHGVVGKATISRWLRVVLKRSGIDTNIFAPHSIRGASTSMAAAKGIPIETIMKAGGWSRESTFGKFYKRKVSTNLGKELLEKFIPTK